LEPSEQRQPLPLGRVDVGAELETGKPEGPLLLPALEDGGVEIAEVGNPQRTRTDGVGLQGGFIVAVTPRFDGDGVQAAATQVPADLEFQSGLATPVTAAAPGKALPQVVGQRYRGAVQQQHG